MKLACLRSGGGEPEVFLSEQGEGPSAGERCVFVRASFCNLYCRWCDTEYTWNWEGTVYGHDRDGEAGYAKYRKEDEVVELAVEEVAERVRGFACGRVVMTGGEPLVQRGECERLLEILRRGGGEWYFEMETNGTIMPGPDLAGESGVDQFNVSPKLANSGVPKEARLKEDVLGFFAGFERAYFKFVVCDERDVREVGEMVERCGMDRERVYLMPEGVTAAALDARVGWVVEVCEAEGYQFSDRKHVREFGGGRGV
ncbi:MAG: 7-carboxy-7-deazaguanine synthase QueE [Verrucomicrobiota bacterium]